MFQSGMVSHHYKCIFVHIPKTAGKTVLGAFGLPEFGRDYNNRHEAIEDPYDHIPLYAYRNRQYFDRYFKFCFVRNPWDRLVSAFEYLNAGGSNEQDRTYRDTYLRSFGGNFSLFVRSLPSLIEHKHFRPQVRWLTPVYRGELLEELGLDFVGRFESFDADMRRVAERLGLRMSGLEHRNRSSRSPCREYYDTATADLVAEIYREDIRALGYEYGPLG